MKKTNNKGFSLVELIIVIAIMAILAGAIAPALIRYIDKSRKSNDVSSAKTIKTAVETALGNEDIYAYLVTSPTTGKNAVIEFVPGKSTSTAAAGAGSAVTSTSAAMKISNCNDVSDASVADVGALTISEIGTNIGEKIPKLKYGKANKDDKVSKCKETPQSFYAVINNKGTVFVMISKSGITDFTTVPGEGDAKVSEYTAAYPICPEACGAYQ